MIDWLLSLLWYGGVLAAAIGLLTSFKPPGRLGLTTRWRGAGLLALALVVVVLNARLLPSAKSLPFHSGVLDDITPLFHFREVHEQTIDAPADRVLAAIKSVTAGEIALFQAFTAIRRFGRPGPDSILNAPEAQPILDVAVRSGFLLLADSDREIVVGTIVAAPADFRGRARSIDRQWFREGADPGVVKATMNFRIVPESPTRTRVVTETRVIATDEAGLKRFTPYWRTIFPGSWILRVTWLNAIAKRSRAAPDHS